MELLESSEESTEIVLCKLFEGKYSGCLKHFKFYIHLLIVTKYLDKSFS